MKLSAYRKFLQLILTLALLLLPAACETAQTAPPCLPGQPYASAEPGPVAGLTLRSGDVIEIKFAFAPQLNQTETVRPDGKVELQLVGDILVEGKTPEELQGEIMKLYAVQLRHPQLAVIVKGFNERKVYVGGEVKKTGPVPMPGEMTVLEAIMNAGGMNTETADSRDVIVIRNVDGHIVGRSIDLKGVLDGAKAPPFYLRPRDVVYVPQTGIAKTDTWFQQHVWKLLPPLGIGATLY